ncbi:hypothetical protein RRG08_044000 [Elysia crispata]|uniref:Uncharacterized protein n=1 Tax=Elysia crispata TaxID=231223 RepID=A0AAE0Y2V2_9GAST|nr:hypothetical protein RRG08_044000 [Elysia crispata]
MNKKGISDVFHRKSSGETVASVSLAVTARTTGKSRGSYSCLSFSEKGRNFYSQPYGEMGRSKLSARWTAHPKDSHNLWKEAKELVEISSSFIIFVLYSKRPFHCLLYFYAFIAEFTRTKCIGYISGEARVS